MIQPPDDGLKECRYGQEWRQVGVITANLLPRFCNFFNMYMHRQTLTRIGPDSENELRIFRCKNWPTVACPLEMQAQRLIGSNGNYYVVKKDMHRNCEWEEKMQNGGNAENSGANEEQQEIQESAKAVTKRRKSNVVNNNEDSGSTINFPDPAAVNDPVDDLADNNITPAAVTILYRKKIWRYVCTIHSPSEFEEARQRHYTRQLSVERQPNNLRCYHYTCPYKMLLRDGEKEGEQLLYERNEHNHPLKQRNGGDEVVQFVSTPESSDLRPKQQANRGIKNVGSSCLALQATPKSDARRSKRRQQAMEEEEEERETTTDDDEYEEEGSANDSASQDKQLLPLPNNEDRHAQFVKMAKELGLNCNSLLGDTFFCAPGNATLNLTLGVNDRFQAVQIIGSAGIRVLDVHQRMAGKMHWVWSLGCDWPQFLWALRGLTYLFFSTTTQQRQEESGQCVVQEPSEEHQENANAPTEFSITEAHPELPIESIIGHFGSAVQFQREIGGFTISQKNLPKSGRLPRKSSTKPSTSKLTFLQDRGSVRVMEIARGEVISDERWSKIGREQFCYAVLGKCTAVFLAEEPLNNPFADTPSTSGSK